MIRNFKNPALLMARLIFYIASQLANFDDANPVTMSCLTEAYGIDYCVDSAEINSRHCHHSDGTLHLYSF